MHILITANTGKTEDCEKEVFGEEQRCRPDFYCHFLPKNEPYREDCAKDVALQLWGPVTCALTVVFFLDILFLGYFRIYEDII